MTDDTPLRRRHFLQATLAATALGGAPSVADAAAYGGTDGYGEGGYGQGGYGGASPFAEPVGRSAARPQDRDGDGTYEDVDGDGRVTVLDVQTLYAFQSSQVVQANIDRLDFDGDGDVDTMDAVALFYQYVENPDSPE